VDASLVQAQPRFGLAALAGTPEWVVSRRLGHAHVQTTIDLYGWVREDEALQAAANWKSYASSWQVPDGR